MKFTAASTFLALLAATQTVDGSLSPSRGLASSLSQKNGWFYGTTLRGGSMGKFFVVESDDLVFLV